ncbi:CpaF family protein [Methylomicrobium sp. RS1]|uniref:CpaF family protein n=1 Tax=Candidatus Methylomicrobium oryzae TaxID=2802053 RepID=UPI0019218E7F|nr:CpaF family protein [Methylomicrobium sp. RS1]MBL1263665.1 CpaF family protein [Methylomicrobium sp. RS1]
MELKNRIKNFGKNFAVEHEPKEVAVITEPVAPTKENTNSSLDIKALSQVEMEFKDVVYEKLLDTLDLTLLSSIPEVEARKQIVDIIHRLIDKESFPLNAPAKKQIIKEICDEVLGYGPLEPLLHEPTVSDILVNGSQKVYVERFGRLELSPVRFKDNNHLMKIIDRIVSRVGRRIDESSPMVDARLPDGSRVNAIIPPLALDGPSLSIRRFSADKMKLDDLVERGALTVYMAEFLKAAAKSKLNILISGGTGSGKTTMLNAISNYIPARERVITLEDSAELQLQIPHVLRLETRPPNTEGRGEVSLRDLVRNSLRMRPDRIVIGEVRSGEAFDMLQAMNTGHEGSLTTVHANNSRDALARLENMVSMAGLELPMVAVRKQISSAINIIIQLNRLEDGSRRVLSIQEVDGMEGDIITLAEIFRFNRQGVNDDGSVRGNHSSTGIVPKCLDRINKMGSNLNLSCFTNNL